MGNGSKKKRVAEGIVKRLRRKGYQAYFVGGCVRDMVMRKAPKDFDIATEARPAQIKQLFAHKTYPVGAKFGTLLLVEEKIPFQISTFRTKAAKFTQDLSEDVKARDFTVNGLAYDPIKKQLIDLVGARDDIRKKKIRAGECAPDKFRQDPLRLLRAIRLAVTLGFSVETETLKTIKKLARLIKKVSKERIRDELILIFTSVNPSRGLDLLDETGLLKYTLPFVVKLKGVRQPQAFHPEGDVYTHTLLMLKALKSPSLVLAFACLFHDVGKPQTFQIADRIRFSGHDKLGAGLTDKILRELRFSNKDRADIVACVENHMRMMEAPKMRQATLKRLFNRSTFNEELRLHYVDCIASHRDLTVFRFLNKKYNEFKKRPKIPKPLLSGYELIKMNFTPGPIFGKIHRQMVDLQLEGKLKNKKEAERWVRKRWPK